MPVATLQVPVMPHARRGQDFQRRHMGSEASPLTWQSSAMSKMLICLRLLRLMLMLVNPYYLWYNFSWSEKFHFWLMALKSRVGFESAQQKKQMLEWVRSKTSLVRRSPINFTDDWSDGITLCALIDAVAPGSCPSFYLLNAENGFSNIRLALSLIEKKFDFDPEVDAKRIFRGTEEKNLYQLLKRLKLESVKHHFRGALTRPIVKLTDENGRTAELDFSGSQQCIAKGMGLILAVKGRRARFNIFFRSVTKLNLAVEVIGPDNSVGYKKLISSLKALLSPSGRKIGLSDLRHAVPTQIPISCEVSSQQVSVTYVPVTGGVHLLNVLWDDQHVPGSPYTVKVDGTNEEPTSPDRGSLFPRFLNYNRETLKSRVVRQRILKQVIVINGKEEPFTAPDGLNLFKDIDKFDSAETCAPKRKVSIGSQHIRPRLADIVERERERRFSLSPMDAMNIVPHPSPRPNEDEVAACEDSVDAAQSAANVQIEEHTSPVAAEKAESSCIVNYALIPSFPAGDQNLAAHSSMNALFDDIMSNVSNSAELDERFQELADNVIDDLADVSTIQDVLSRDTTPFKSFLPKRKAKNVPSKVEKLVNWLESPGHLNLQHYCRPELSSASNLPDVVEPAKSENVQKSSAEAKATERFIKSFQATRDFWKYLERSGHQPGDANIVKGRDEEDGEAKSGAPSWQQQQQVYGSSDEDGRRFLNDHKHLSSNQLAAQPQDELQTPDSQADSGIGPVNLVANPDKLFTELAKVATSSESGPSAVASGGDEEASNTGSSGTESSRRYSFPLLSGNFSTTAFAVIGRNRECGSSSSSDEDATYNTTSASTIGFIDDEINDCPSFVGSSVPLTGSREELLELFPSERGAAEAPESSGIFPHNCRAYGSGLYYGQVGSVNQFQVTTENAGGSSLSVGIQGSQPDDVHSVSVNLMADNLHCVKYEVTRPGYYIIFVRWGDCHITDSPFICKVTF